MLFLKMLAKTCCILFVAGLTLLRAETKEKEPSQNAVQKQLLATRYVSQIELSPNNKHLLLVYTTPQIFSSAQEEHSGWVNELIIKNEYTAKTSLTTKFETHKGVLLPTWTRDSKAISYVSQGDKFLSLWVSSPQKFKPRKILELDTDIISYQWSPDGKKLAVVAKVSLPEESVKVVYETNKPELYKLYVFDVNEKMKPHSPVVMPSSFALTNSTGGSFSWAPDNQNVIVSHDPLENGSSTQFSQVSLISIKTQQIKPIEKGKGVYLSPFISPDGKFVAYVTNDLPENAQLPIRVYGMDASRVCITNLKSYEKRCLAKTPNENPTLIGWKKDSQSLLVMDREGNADHIYEMGIDGKASRRLTQGDSSLKNVLLNSASDIISYSATDLKMPAEGYIASIDPFQPQKVTSSSALILKNDFSVETVHWKSKDSKFDLEGLFLYPKGTQRNMSFPLITLLPDYSSPVSPLEYVGNLTEIPLVYAPLLDKGYALFIPNRRGSNGYGVQFRQAIFKELGGGDYEDVMSGIDHLINKKKVDPQELALWGWGYGGYLTAWALTQTDRFNALIIGEGITDLISQIGTTTSPALLEAIMGGPYWKDWECWRKKSPLSHIKAGKTPTLLQYEQFGQKVWNHQGQELYFALRILGVPVKMISYRYQGNPFSSPHTVLLALRDLEAWLETYFKPQSRNAREE